MGFDNQVRILDAIIDYLSPQIGRLLKTIPPPQLDGLEEIRLRVGQPLLLNMGQQEYALSRQGAVVKELRQAYRVQADDVYKTILSISDNSLYAFEEEIRRGYITIPGGHRVGLAGRSLWRMSRLKPSGFQQFVFPDCQADAGLLAAVAGAYLPTAAMSSQHLDYLCASLRENHLVAGFGQKYCRRQPGGARLYRQCDR